MRCTISRMLNYTDAKGREAELEVEIDMDVFHPRGESIYAEFFAASYRNKVGQRIDVRMDEWLTDWIRDAFEEIDESELYAVSGVGF